MKKILIVKMSSLGDILHVLPVIYSLLQRYPGLCVDWVVDQRCKDLVSCFPIINKAIIFNTAAFKKGFFSSQWFREIHKTKQEVQSDVYDCVIDFQGNCKSSLPVFWARSKVKVGFGKKSVSEWPNIWVTNKQFEIDDAIIEVRERYYGLVNRFLGEDLPRVDLDLIRFKNEEHDNAEALRLIAPLSLEKKPIILLHPGCSTWKKRMSQSPLSFILSSLRLELGCQIACVWWTQEEKEYLNYLASQDPDHIHLISKVSVGLLRSLMRQADGIIAFDSFALHLTGFVSTPTFSFFGPTLAKAYAPRSQYHQSYQAKCPYKISFDKARGSKCAISRCKTANCLQSLSDEQLINEMVRFFKKHAVVFQDPALSLSND
ncbi:MAG: glycosyltransferase family 9 protein [Candidatus Comchoanobacterales bacterium]